MNGESMEKVIQHILSKEMKDVLMVQTSALKAIHDYMWKHEILQLMPVMLSSVTDPLSHSVYDSSITYAGQKLELTKSMILHKQMSIMRGDLKGIYIISPNIRLEKEHLGETGRHLLEFSQVDIELRDAKYKDFMRFTEGLYSYIFKFVKKKCKEELASLERKIKVPKKPFKIYESAMELKVEYGSSFDLELSKKEKDLFWVMDHYREFYDREDPVTKRHVNYDLVYPEGFGEALSGGERETDYATIIRKMGERKTDLEKYKSYIEISKRGLLKPTAGGGFGVERLVRFLTGRKHIRDISLFPRVPGEEIVL